MEATTTHQLKFGKYIKYVDFLRDESVTTEQLKNIIDSADKGACRYVTKHPGFTPEVLEHMQQSPVWYIRMVGLFHYSLPEDIIKENALVNLNNADRRIRNKAVEMLKWLEEEAKK